MRKQNSRFPFLTPWSKETS